jgi:hypothetical protein
MRTSFHGWRRKTGVVSLLMACVLMAAWVRSQTTIDLLMVTAFGRQVNFISGSGAFMTVCGTLGAVGQKYDPKKLPQPRSTGVYFNCERLSDDRSKPIAWKNWSDSSLNIYVISRRDDIEIPLISYVSIVLPLTLLSAYLILWKPRKRPSPFSGQ